MTKNTEYLTDKDLERMVCDLEQNDTVQAPPDLMLEILETLEQGISKEKELEKQEKIIAYKRYRFQVLTTVAAAVLIVLLLPKLSDLQQQKSDFVEHNYEFEMQGRYETKEEALNDRGMLEKLLGQVNIFEDNSKFNLFKE